MAGPALMLWDFIRAFPALTPKLKPFPLWRLEVRSCNNRLVSSGSRREGAPGSCPPVGPPQTEPPQNGPPRWLALHNGRGARGEGSTEWTGRAAGMAAVGGAGAATTSRCD
eukprot:5454563-Pyramimonas_sp.AAC.1